MKMKLTDQALDYVRDMLANHAASGNEFSYSVKVNNLLPIISRSKDVSQFDNITDHFYDEETYEVNVTIHSGKSTGGKTMKLWVEGKDAPQAEEKKQKKTETLQGIDHKTEMAQLRKQIEEEIELRNLREENVKLKEELQKAEAFSREVDVMITRLHARREKVNDKGTLQILGDVVRKFAMRKPEMFKDIPLVDMVAGLLPGGEEETTKPPDQEQPLGGTVSITPKGENKAEPVDKDTQENLEIVKGLKEDFSRGEFGLCLNLLYLLKHDKQMIEPTCRWVQKKIVTRQNLLNRQPEPPPPPKQQTAMPQAEKIQNNTPQAEQTVQPQAQHHSGENSVDEISDADLNVEPNITWQ